MKERFKKVLRSWNNLPSKITAILWTYWGIQSAIKNPVALFPDFIIVMLFGYFVFCGFATLMYRMYRDIKNNIISGSSDASDSTASIPTKIGKFSSTVQQTIKASNETVFDENEILNNLVTIIPSKENNAEKPKEDLLTDEVSEEDITFHKTQGTPDSSVSFEHVSTLLEKAKRLADTINTTIDKTTFENSLADLKNTLTYLTKYERYGLFSGTTPTQDLKHLLETEPKARVAFEERMLTKSSITIPISDTGHTSTSNYELDSLFADAGRFIIEKDNASIGMLQRVFKIGFNRAAHVVDQLCEYGVVGDEEGTRPRKVLMNLEQFETLLEEVPYKDILVIEDTYAEKLKMKKEDEKFISKFDLNYSYTSLDKYEILKNIENIYCHSVNDEELIEKLLVSMMDDTNPNQFRYIICNLSIINNSLIDFNGESFLLIPVITDARFSTGMIEWLYAECKERYERFQTIRVKNIEAFNSDSSADSSMPYITVLIDEIYILFKYIDANCNSEFREHFLFSIMNSQRVGIRLIFLTQYEAGFISGNFNRFLKLFKYYTQDELQNLVRKLSNSLSALEDAAKPQIILLSTIDNMSGTEFEEYSAKLLEANGFANIIVTQGSGDHGIDILAEKDGISYAIQCKCYSGNIGNAAVQQALAGRKYYKKDIAVVLTNQYFTTQAQEEAAAFGVKLWDRDKLNELIEKSDL